MKKCHQLIFQWKSLGTEKPQYSWAEVSGSVSTWPLSMLPSTQPYRPTHLLDSWTVSPGPPLTLLHLYQEGKKCRLPTWPPGVLQCPAGLLGTTTVWGLDSYWSLTRAGLQVAQPSRCGETGEGLIAGDAPGHPAVSSLTSLVPARAKIGRAHV